MTRRGLAVVAAMAIAGVVGVVPAAGAGEDAIWPLTCIEDMQAPPPLTTVSLDEEGLHVNLDGVDPDVAAAEQYAIDASLQLVACIVEPIPTGNVTCLYGVVTNIGSYVNVSPPMIDVYFPALTRDVQSCLGIL